MIRNWINRLFVSKPHGRRSSSRPAFRPHLLHLEDRIVPALIYVDPTIVGNAGDIVTFNAGRDGAVGGLTLGTDAFTSFDAAVTAAVAGDTVFLAQATISTSVDFEIDRSLSFVGSGAGLTILNPNASTASDFGSDASWLEIIGGASVSFTGITFNGLSTTFGIGEAIRYVGSSGTVTSSVFTSISRAITGNIYEGVGVVAVDSTVTVSGNVFTNMGRSGAVFTSDLTVGTFSNNTYTGKGAGDFIDNAVEASFGASLLMTGNTISNNLGIASADGSLSTGVIISDPGTTATLIGNTFSNNQIGVRVGFDPADTAVAVLQYNNIVGNVIGLSTDVAPGFEVNASLNFFGTTNGPVSEQNPGGTGDFIETEGAAPIIGPFLREATPVIASTSVPSYVSEITPPEIYAVAAGAGGGPRVSVFQNGVETFSFFAYTPTFTGGVRVAVGDVDGDGIDDIITAAGAGGGPHVQVFDAFTGAVKQSFFAFVDTFTGGVFLTVGDIDGDKVDDIIVAAGAGGGPHVKVFDGRTATEKLSFFAYDAGFSGGVSVGLTDLNGDFIQEIVTGAGFGGAPHVRAFDGITATELLSFFAFDTAYGGGITVSGGDIDGDIVGEIFVGSNFGISTIGVFNSAGNALRVFDAGPITGTNGVRVGAADLPGNGTSLILVGAGAGQNSTYQFIDPVTGESVFTSDAFGTSLPGGIFVG